MLLDTKPQSFSDLIRISGLSHGTDVWLGNAQTLIEEGKATISTAICTRDDIMIYLIDKGLESELSFTIMESVRKGKGLKPEWEEEMKAHDVPDWYIWSCKKIKYMFPKAHAAAYVMMAYRIAYYKIFYPLAYYAAYFSIRASAFSYELMCMGRDRLEYYMKDYEKRKDTLTQKEQATVKDMKIVQEMYARGFDFVPVDLYKAQAHRFQVYDDKHLMPASTRSRVWATRRPTPLSLRHETENSSRKMISATAPRSARRLSTLWRTSVSSEICPKATSFRCSTIKRSVPFPLQSRASWGIIRRCGKERKRFR